MPHKKRYWKSLEEYQDPKPAKIEKAPGTSNQGLLDLLTPQEGGVSSNRRDFLKLLGFSVTTAALVASCEKPVQKAIPYLSQPEEIIPGKSLHYASSFFDGSEYCSVVVKTRDGRPIKIEGNELCPLTRGGTSARVQASVLSLYDDARYKQPTRKGKPIAWEEADKEIKHRLTELKEKREKLVILTGTLIGPTTLDVLEQFTRFYPNAKHVVHDSSSVSAILEAYKEIIGKSILPDLSFDKAKIIVGFQADFLGTWLMPTRFTRQYSQGRQLSGDETTMHYHVQYESGLSLTGTNADRRIPIRPSEEKNILLGLYNEIANLAGITTGHLSVNTPVETVELAKQLWSCKGESILVSSTNDLETQKLIIATNYLLGNFGKTIDLDNPLKIRSGIDRDLEDLIGEMQSGAIKGIIVLGANPVHDHPLGRDFADSLQKMQISLSLDGTPNETNSLCEIVCPSHHFLESWDDAEPVKNHFRLTQPVINPLFNTRPAMESLLVWRGIEKSSHALIREYWEKNIYPKSASTQSFEAFWTTSLQDGVASLAPERASTLAIDQSKALGGIKPNEVTETSKEIQFVETTAIGNGVQANNPWLQELPDPVTKVCWDNYALISISLANELNISDGDIVEINDRVSIPALILPGVSQGVIALPVGYGRNSTGKVADNTGVNVAPLMKLTGGRKLSSASLTELKKTGKKKAIITTQIQHSMDGRDIVRETSLEEYLKPGHDHGKHEHPLTTLYPGHKFGGHHWGMAVDLTLCTGCSTCVIACQSENNISVVGPEEVKRNRIMHWIRIDRYFEGKTENPSVFHHPVMCQHCDNAPCENVCPVAATNHSSEGLNQMAYNRCIGTKYCINNCPYRVRRFNWFRYVDNVKFDYNKNSELGKMTLNPDVTVRERGVVEKCSFCVQRIQEKKLEAKIENRPLQDGEIKTACMQACPSGALVFGDLNDPGSKISQLFASKRNYFLLEELHTLPSVGYLTKVRNKK